MINLSSFKAILQPLESPYHVRVTTDPLELDTPLTTDQREEIHRVVKVNNFEEASALEL